MNAHRVRSLQLASVLVLASALAPAAPAAGAGESHQNHARQVSSAAAFRALGVIRPGVVARKLGLYVQDQDTNHALRSAISGFFAGTLVRVSAGHLLFYNPIYDLGLALKTDRSAGFFFAQEPTSSRLRARDIQRRGRRFAAVNASDLIHDPLQSEQLFGAFALRFVDRAAFFERQGEALQRALTIAIAKYPFLKHASLLATERRGEIFGLLMSPVQSGDLLYRFQVNLASQLASPMEVIRLLKRQ